MHFYRLVQFHTRIRFCASLSVRLSDSGHHVTYFRKFCRNKPSHKIYHCMSVRSTRYHTLLHNTMIIHIKIFFAPVCHPLQIYLFVSSISTRHHALLNNPTILYTKKFFCAILSPAQENIVHFKIQFKIFES